MARKPDWSVHTPDPRFDPWRERVGRLYRDGTEVGLLLVRVDVRATQSSGHWWWTKWSPNWPRCSPGWHPWWCLPTTTVWSGTAGTPLTDIAMRAERVNHSGARLADDVEAMAMELRTRLADSRSERAARSAVYITMPLACCFLPAFVVVGLVPVGIGLLSGMA